MNKEKLIGFEFVWDETPLLIELGKELKSQEFDIVGVTLGKRWMSELKSGGFQTESLSSFFKKNINKVNVEEEITRIRNTYNNSEILNHALAIDRYLHYVSRGKILSAFGSIDKFAVLHVMFWEYFFKKHPVKVFYTTGTGFYALMSGYMVAKKLDIEFKGIFTTRFSNPSVAFVDNIEDQWKLLGEEVPDQEFTNEAKTYIESIRNRSASPSYMKDGYQGRSFNLKKLRLLKKRIWQFYFERWGWEKFDYVTPRFFWRFLQEFKVSIKRIIVKAMFPVNKANYNSRPYIYYALHLQPEVSCDMLGKYVNNQIQTVENLSKALPYGFNLVVKEHTVALGKREGLINYYKKLSKIPNVVLVSPKSSSLELIEGSSAVCTVSGTVGWEALILKKPVFTLGRVFYSKFQEVFQVESFYELEKLFKSVLLNYKWNEEKEVKLVNFVASCIQSTHKGYFNVPQTTDYVLSKENIENLSGAIKQDHNLRSV